jgi:hypothetical protein
MALATPFHSVCTPLLELRRLLHNFPARLASYLYTKITRTLPLSLVHTTQSLGQGAPIWHYIAQSAAEVSECSTNLATHSPS